MFKNKKAEEDKIPEEHTIANITQRAVLYDQKTQKFLIAKCSDSDADFYKKFGPWEFVGGRVNKGEELLDALKREVKEEAGEIEFEIVDSLGNFLMELKSRKVILLAYLVNYLEGEIKLDIEHSEYKWQTAKEILENKEHKEWLKYFVKKAEEIISSQKNINGWKRCQADFENYRKMQDESRKQLKEFVLEDLTLQILPVVDNFEMSLEHVPEDQSKSPWLQGILHIQRQLETILKDNGVSEIVVKVGDKFDPNFHEAIHQESENSNQESENKIKKIISKGYKIGDKVIRAVKVIVG
ncbi:MAG: nucleotide exchange factor GrpE [Parcubacteria group bacterium]|jgi:molecular chaperone GrpE